MCVDFFFMLHSAAQYSKTEAKQNLCMCIHNLISSENRVLLLLLFIHFPSKFRAIRIKNK